MDFEYGFYTTTNLNQAINFAGRVAERREDGKPHVSMYKVAEIEELRKRLKILMFPEANEEWLDFVYANRSASYSGEYYDIVFDPVANDTIYRTFVAYEEGILTKGETIPRLIHTMMEKQNITEKEALTALYGSELYRQLEREETKLWHLSVLTLYHLWLEEKETGKITYPEEG